MSRERQSRQRKKQGYSTYMGKKQSPQGAARPHRDKWVELNYYKKANVFIAAAFTGIGCLWVLDALLGTHFFGPPAWIGIALYTAWQLWRLKKADDK
jgi:hypothetical protein